MEELGLSLALILVILLILAAAIRVIPEDRRWVVFRLGRLIGTVGPGRVLLLPVLDRAVPVDLRPRTRRAEKETALTRDRHRVTADLSWAYQVVDPAKCVLNVKSLDQALQNLAMAALRTAVGARTLNQVSFERDPIRAQVEARLREVTADWGIEIERVEVRSLARG